MSLPFIAGCLKTKSWWSKHFVRFLFTHTLYEHIEHRNPEINLLMLGFKAQLVCLYIYEHRNPDKLINLRLIYFIQKLGRCFHPDYKTDMAILKVHRHKITYIEHEAIKYEIKHSNVI